MAKSLKSKIGAGLLVGLTIAAAAAPISAQNYGWGNNNFGNRNRGPVLILYTGVNFTGESRTITQDIPNLDAISFRGAAGSLRAVGDWSVCLGENYTVRCRTYNSEIPNLESYRARISSVRFVGNGTGNYGNGYNNGYGNGYGNNYGNQYQGRATRGTSVVFYPGTIPNARANQTVADEFCRNQGHGSAVFYNGRGNQLEDVVCR